MKVQRRVPVDVLARDGETAVLFEGHLVRLSPLSAAIFEVSGDPISLEDLVTELVARFGLPGQDTPLNATKDAVTEMARHGVLRQR